MNDQDFRDTVINELATIKTNTEHITKDVEGHHKTLYGREGRTGIVQEIESLKQSQGRWNRALVIVQALIMLALGYLGLKR